MASPVPVRLRLVESNVDEIASALDTAEHRIYFASPFIGHTPGSLLAERIIRRKQARPGLEARGLTSLTRESVALGFSSARGIHALLQSPCELRAIVNSTRSSS